MKKCRDCLIEKSLNEFHLDVSKKDTRRSYCKDCSKIRSRNNYQNNRDARRKQQKSYNDGNRERIAKARRNYAEKNKNKLAEYLKKYKIENEQRLRENLENDYFKRVKYLVRAAKVRANDRNHEFTLTYETASYVLIGQNFKCAILGINFDFKFSSEFSFSPYGISIDRIDSKRGYTPDNIQFVCAIVNMAKGQFPQEIFDMMCKLRMEKLNAKI